MRNPLRLIRVRLTIWHVLSLTLLLALFSSGVYIALRGALQENLDNRIETRVQVLMQVIQVEDGLPVLPIHVVPPGPVDDEVENEVEGNLDDEGFIRVFDSSGGLLLDTSALDEELPPLIDDVRPVLAGAERWLRVQGEEDTFRVLAVPISRNGNIIGAIAVAESEEDMQETLGTLEAIIGLAFPMAVLSAGLVGFILAERALAPVDRITQTARQLSAKNLNQRLGLDLPDDELGRLERTFDDMLERLDGAFQRQRRFTADASHELRTPLTIMRGEIEVTLSRPRDTAEYRKVLEAVGEQSDRLIDLVNSLLLLARADAGEIPIQRDAVDVPAAVEIAIEQMRSLADEAGVTLSAAGPAVTIPADLTLFHQLLFNLLDNAIRHTPEGGSVRVTWILEQDHLRLEVHDTGTGIAAEHLPLIFDRFYRVDAARGRNEGRVGIGLAISRWIADAHGGSISAKSQAGAGSTFTVTMPANPHVS